MFNIMYITHIKQSLSEPFSYSKAQVNRDHIVCFEQMHCRLGGGQFFSSVFVLINASYSDSAYLYRKIIKLTLRLQMKDKYYRELLYCFKAMESSSKFLSVNKKKFASWEDMNELMLALHFLMKSGLATCTEYDKFI